MKLSRLEIFGFKSFAKKLDLTLSGGITSVVGPNGCGKANVVDAIRWVLGEQRPTQIRLERMEDVLFKGSASRRPLGMTEVSLTIDNDSGILPVDLPQITITRRLFRSGESDYLINRKSCRLADIHDLLMDTGMGTDSYSVFELAMINSILSDKTDDRRHIFEEAAGITKYKARRRTALGKLAGIEQDLERLGDIVAELERRVESLRRQAARARRYRELRGEIRDRTVAAASRDLAALEAVRDRENREVERLTGLHDAAAASVARAETDRERLAIQAAETETALADAARRHQDSTAAINEIERDMARSDTRLESLRELIERSRAERSRTAASFENIAEAHGACAGSLDRTTAELAALETDRAAAEALFREAVTAADAARVEYARLEESRRELDRTMGKDRADLAAIRANIEAADRRNADLAAGMDAAATDYTAITGELDRLEKERLVLSEREHAAAELVEVRTRECDATRTECEDIDERIRVMREHLSRVAAERDLLARLTATLEEYEEGVRAAAAHPPLKERIHGVLADLIRVEERYAPAIRAALTDHLQHLVVETAADALAGVRHLTDTRAGRAAFLPLDEAAESGRPLPPPEGPGILGPAHRFVQAGERYRDAVNRLLAGVVVVDTLETALALRRSRPDLTVVTLDGESAGTAGDIRGGRSRQDAGRELGRADRLKELIAAVAAIEDDLASAETDRRDRREILARRREAVEEAGASLDEARKRMADHSAAEAHTTARKDALAETIARYRGEWFVLKDSAASGGADTAAVELRISDAERELAAIEERRLDGAEALAQAETTREVRRTEANDLAVAHARLTEQKAALARERESLEGRRTSLAHAARRTEEEIEKAEAEIMATGERKQDASRRLAELESGHAELTRARDEIEHRLAECRAGLSEQDRTLQRLRHELDEHDRTCTARTLARDEAGMRADAIRERLADEFYLDPESIHPVPAEQGYDPAEEKLLIEDLRRKLQNLGDVNLAAEDDFRTENERLEFLARERDDLVAAGEKLKETIARINAVATDRFLGTFAQVRLNFQQMFREFFGGGDCDLALEGDADPLEASIAITAQPPGKNVNTINLLSSGERALTAISLLFAIYLVKPSPFCILDEVDAPLDDANLDRFLGVIREFSARTQFIIVTHNKKTMAAADNLYGITMAEAGLSTLVSVQLREPGGEPTALAG